MGTDLTSNASDAEGIPISTGQTVHLPVEAEATMLGVVFPAHRGQVDALLPDGIRPIRATPSGKAAITFLSVEYHEVGVDGIDPYDEFAVVIPAVHGSTVTIPYLSPLARATSGYVWYLPVTTEPAKAFGVDVWGYPKVVADIAHQNDGTHRRTTVTVDGKHFVTLAVDRPPSIRLQDDGYNYTVKDDEVQVVRIDVDADVGGWPFSRSVSVSFGGHPRAEQLRELDIGSRALARISLDGRVRFNAGKPLGTD